MPALACCSVYPGPEVLARAIPFTCHLFYTGGPRGRPALRREGMAGSRALLLREPGTINRPLGGFRRSGRGYPAVNPAPLPPLRRFPCLLVLFADVRTGQFRGSDRWFVLSARRTAAGDRAAGTSPTTH